eukprot:Phypoly_transcript_01852.p1 GENE.Phypoly_transcript_01852~~Phypoly_transcript_01852.p1  ORF type:complete len:921 (+),score=179.80 Phypoly_transcript_01852:230-2992(+)
MTYAFEIIPVALNIPCKVECLDSWGDKMYVGTPDGHVLLYVIEKQKSSDGKTTFKSRMETKKKVGGKKAPVTKIEVFPDIGRVFVLCDGNLDVLNAFNLDQTSPLGAGGKGVSTFATKKKSQDYRVCVQARKKLTLYECMGSYVQYKEIALTDNASSIAWMNDTIAVAYKREYVLIDVSSGTTTPVFTIDKSTPLLSAVDGDFLFAIAQAGVFVGFNGMPTRGNLTWTNTPVAIGYYQPYLLSLQSKAIEIHNVHNQSQVQTLNFPNNTTLEIMSDARGELVLVSTASSPASIYALVPIPVQIQVENLLKLGLIDDALNLFRVTWEREAARAEATEADYNRELAKIHESAGMLLLQELNCKPAFMHFNQSSIDPRVLIYLVPGLLAPQSTFNTAGQNTVADLIAKKPLTNTKPIDVYLTETRQCLVKFLEKRCDTSVKDDIHKDINTALVKLYAGMNAPQLEVLLRAGNLHAQDLENWLTENKHYHSLGLLYKHLDLLRKALKVWEKLGSGEYKDASYDGVSDSIEVLSLTDNKELVWQFAPWLLNVSAESAVRIFTSNRRKVPLPADDVLEFLAPYGNFLCQFYLEYLVNVENNPDEKYSTKLAMLYIDSIFTLDPNLASAEKANLEGTTDADQSILREKLVHLLETSPYYNPHAILARIMHSALFEELVCVYKKMEQYENLFKVLVWKLAAPGRAERICFEYKPEPPPSSPEQPGKQKRESMYSKNPNNLSSPSLSSLSSPSSSETADSFSSKRQLLFLTLFKTYLHPPASLKAKDKDTGKTLIPQNALDFLSRASEEIDPIRILELLPDDIPVQAIAPYLSKVMRANTHRRRDGQITRNLKKSENLRVKCQHVYASAPAALITAERTCPVCKKRIGDKVFAFFPNGVIVHFKCFNLPYMCPVTGHDFYQKPRPLPYL